MRFTSWYDFSIFISYLRYFALRLTKPNLNLPCALTCAIAKPNLDFSKLGFLVSDSFQIFYSYSCLPTTQVSWFCQIRFGPSFDLPPFSMSPRDKEDLSDDYYAMASSTLVKIREALDGIYEVLLSAQVLF